MRNRSLHDALRGFALEAAALLTDDVAAGSELAFDVEEARGRGGATLYSYRPLTAEFIAERWPRLRSLPAYAPAARALGSGASAYLRLRGAPGADAEPALRAMLERLYEEATGFEFPEERYERVYAEVERVLYEHAMHATVLAPLRGVAIDSDRVELGGGLALARGDLVEAPVEAVWADAPGDEPRPNVLCLLERDVEAGAELPVDDARERFLALQTALRLFRPGAVAVGPLGWTRADDGAWQHFALAAPAQPRGGEWRLAREEEEALRTFLGALGGASHGGPVAWALSRFEMGCDRERDVDALTDHLLALGALLGDGDDPGRASIALRVAALCAEEGARRAVQRRVETAFELERYAVSRGAPHAAGPHAYLDAIGPDSPAELAVEVEQHLRALLSDVLCGHLPPDLRALADELLLAAGEPFQIEARAVAAPGGAPREIRVRRIAPDGGADAAGWPVAPEPAAAPATEPPAQEALPFDADPRPAAAPAPAGPEPAGPGAADVEIDRRARPDEGELESVTSEIDALAPAPATFADDDDDPGVTPSADWDFDDDPASYSAPV